MVQILSRGNNKSLDLKIDDLDIVSADARNYPEIPMKYGVNVYQGALTVYNFNPEEGVETLGDGSIGMQFRKPVGKIVLGDVKTKGSIGQTLVKGVIKELAADGISVLEGGGIQSLEIVGDLTTEGDGVVTYHVNGGNVDQLAVGGKSSVKAATPRKLS